ncbi:hypothetical protein EsH8_XIII_000028 [Colletotrichum jinshuiense]
MTEPTGDNLTKLPRWIHTPPAPRFTGITDPETTRDVRNRLETVFNVCHGHKPEHWGFAVVRTVYSPGSDERFQHAIALIQRVARVYNDGEIASVVNQLERVRSDGPIHLKNFPLDVDRRLNNEFKRRYHIDVLQDQDRLDGADVAVVRAYFN